MLQAFLDDEGSWRLNDGYCPWSGIALAAWCMWLQSCSSVLVNLEKETRNV